MIVDTNTKCDKVNDISFYLLTFFSKPLVIWDFTWKKSILVS